jgi:hypothetical protein
MSSRPAIGSTQPPIQWVPGVLFLRVKRLRREADHSPPASAEVKITWVYASSSLYAFVTTFAFNFTLFGDARRSLTMYCPMVECLIIDYFQILKHKIVVADLTDLYRHELGATEGNNVALNQDPF